MYRLFANIQSLKELNFLLEMETKMKLVKSIAAIFCFISLNQNLIASEDNQANTSAIGNFFESSYLDVKVREKKSSCFDFTGIWISDIEGRVVEIKQDACEYISITEKDIGATSYFKLGSWVMGYEEAKDESYLTASRWVDENNIDGRFSITADSKNQAFHWLLSSVSSDRISVSMQLTNPNFASVQYDDYFSRIPTEEDLPEEIESGDLEPVEIPAEPAETPAEADEIM